MSRSSVRVVLRTRPSDEFAQELQISQATKAVTIVHGGRSSGLPSEKSGPPQQYQFKFDGILHNASQEEVFELCATDVIQAALEGYNGTVMCYGQTGAGKTYTMTGDRRSYAARGLIPRAIAATLQQLSTMPGLADWSVSVSYLEIYNEALYDLLDITSSPAELTLYEDARGHVQVSGLRKVTVSSEAEALALFFEGESNRVIGEHQLNRESSRSHSIFMMHLNTAREGGEGSTLASKLFLVDLAGSERVSKTRSEGLVLREAGAINRSLALLEQVVRAAAETGRDHVPYRSCKLTHVLKDSLGGNCKTVLIANVWGEAGQLDETMSTCRFAARMARLVCDVKRNVVGEGGARVRALEREVLELKEELAMMELMTQMQQQQQHAMGTSSSPPYSDTQRQRLREAVVAWLQQQDDADGSAAVSVAALPLSNVRQLREVLVVFKGIIRDLQQTHSSGRPAYSCQAPLPSTPTAAAGQSGAGAPSSSSAAAAAGGHGDVAESNWQGYVGDGDDHTAGAAPDDARPAEYGGHHQHQQQQQQQQGSDDGDEAAGPGPGSMMVQNNEYRNSYNGQQQRSRGATPSRLTNSSDAAQQYMSNNGGATVPDKAAALELYRSGPGAAKSALLNDNHVRLKAAKRRSRQLAVAVNGLKGQLDECKARQEALHMERQALGQDAAESLTPEELQLVVTIRDIKAQYRDTHAELQLVRDEVTYTSGLLDTCKTELVEDFDAWFTATYGAEPGMDIAGGSAASSLVAQQLMGSRPDSSSSINFNSYAGRQEKDSGTTTEGPGQLSSTSSLQQRQQTPPLASLVGSLDYAGDPAAAAYYAAQTGTLNKLAGHRVGSMKKHRGEKGTFSTTERSAINDKLSSRVL